MHIQYSVLSLNIGSSLNAAVQQATKVMIQINAMSSSSMWPFLYAQYAQLFSHSYHRFRFYATIGGFSSKENCVSAAVNRRYHIWKCIRRAGFASNGFQLSLAWSLFIFGRI